MSLQALAGEGLVNDLIFYTPIPELILRIGEVVMDVREELAWFVEAMEEVLRANDYKGGWDDCPLSFLLKGLKREVEELEEALVDGDSASAVRECCDVANFSMMLADRLRSVGG